MAAPTPLVEADVRRRALARLLYAVDRKRLTGRLELDTPHGRVRTFFRDGSPCFVLTPKPVDTLGQILVETGAITPEVFNESLRRLLDAKHGHGEVVADMAAIDSGKRKHGEILREMGAINLETLRHGLALQLRRKVVRLFSIEEGAFQFYVEEHEHGRGETEGIHVDAFWAILQGVRSGYSEPRLARETTALVESAARLGPSFASAVDRFGMTPEERAAADALGREFTPVERFLEASALGKLAARMLLYALWVTDTLDTKRPTAARSTSVAASAGSAPQAETDDFARRVAEMAHAAKSRDYFAVLGVPRDATRERIRDAYVELVRAFHPDRLAAGGHADLRAEVQRIFQAVGEAYRVLGDDERRREHLGTLASDASDGDASDAARKVVEAEMHFQKGLVYLRRQSFELAEEHFGRAVELNPGEGEHHALHAWSRFCHAGNDREGIAAEVRKALELGCRQAPKSARSRYFLGRVLESEGRVEPALRAYREALAIDPDYLDAERQVRLIEMRSAKGRGETGKAGLFERFRKRK